MQLILTDEKISGYILFLTQRGLQMKRWLKKRHIKVATLLMIILFVFYSCSTNTNNNTSSNLKKVTIKRTDGVSVYQLNDKSKIQTVSTVRNKTGITESRSYTYDNVNDLKMIKIDNSAYGTSYMYYRKESQRSDGKILSRTKTVSKARGGSETYKMKYHYNDDGELLGVEMRDEKGNIFTKGVEE